MKTIIILMLFCITNVFSQKLWELELDQNITQVDLMPDNEHFIVVYGYNVEMRRLSDGSFVKEILTEEFKNNYLSSNEFYFTSDFKYFMMKWSNVLFDTETLQPVRKFEATISWSDELIDIGKVQFSKDNKYVFILSGVEFDGEVDAPYFRNMRNIVCVFDFNTGELIKKILIPFNTSNIEISEDGGYLKTFEGIYQYGSNVGEPVAVNIINTESLEFVKYFEPGRYYNSTGFIKNKDIFYYKNTNETRFNFYDLLKSDEIMKTDLGITQEYYTTNLLLNNNSTNLIIFSINKENTNVTNFFKFSYPDLILIDEFIDSKISIENITRVNENYLMSYSKWDPWIKFYDINTLGVASNEEDSYFNFENNKLKFSAKDLIHKNIRIHLFDNNGLKIQTIFDDILINNNLEFDLPILSNGIYHILCETQSKNINYKFMVVR